MYELEQIDKFLRKTIEPALLIKALKENSFKMDWRDFIGSEAERIRQLWIDQVFSTFDYRYNEIYIQSYQLAITKLLDKLSQYQSINDTNKFDTFKKEMGQIYEFTIHELMALFSFIEHYFCRYFDQDTPLPKTYNYLLNLQFNKRQDELNKNLNTVIDDEPLSTIALEPLLDFNQKENPLTFRQSRFVKDLEQELLKLLETSTGQDAKQKLLFLLLYMNYNAPVFFNYYVNYIKNSIAGIEEKEDKLEKLNWHLKVVRQVRNHPDAFYYPDLPPIKDQVSAWIMEEINYLNKICHNTNKTTTEEFTNGIFKLETSLSVAQLSYLIRLLVEARVITNKNQQEIIRFFAGNCKTEKVKEISIKSVRNKYYNAEASTANYVRDLFFKLINLSKKLD